MQYDNTTAAGHTYDLGRAQSPPPQPEDLGSLRARIDDQIKRAHSLADRLGHVGDIVFGPRPESAASGCTPVPECISALANELRRALDRIETNLARL